MKQLFYFSAEWCQPCKTLAPIMEQVAAQIPVQKVNIDYEPDVITKFGVRNIPTVILVENGQEIRRFTGARSYNDIIRFINERNFIRSKKFLFNMVDSLKENSFFCYINKKTLHLEAKLVTRNRIFIFSAEQFF